MPAATPAAHASSLVALPSAHAGEVAAAWFAGERESAPDVRIAYSHFDRQSRQWQPASFILSREELGRQLGHGVRRLGNPVLWRDSTDKLHLFVVATGLGGWAASRIAHLVQVNDPLADEPPRFQARQILPLSWLWNTSHLVRNAPLSLADGGVALPVYFELGAKYPAMVTLSNNGDLAGVSRISARSNLLQPALLAMDSSHWLAFMRMSGGTARIAVAQSHDAGRHWTDLPDLPLPNPNASVAALSLGTVQALTFNPAMNSRDTLSLAVSTDGQRWETLADLERGSAGDEFSYPSMVWTEGALWVSYTNRRQRIAWQRFTPVSE